MSSVERFFLGWESAFLERVATSLLEGWGRDQSEVLVVVPGRRARRRLLALWVEEAGASRSRESEALVPPMIVTPGAVAPALCRSTLPVASGVQRLLAWEKALEASAGVMGAPSFEKTAAFSARLSFAAELSRVQDDLAAAGLSLEVVAARQRSLFDGPEEKRWQAILEAEKVYTRLLFDQGLIDPGVASLDEVDRGGVTTGVIVLCGVVELGARLRSMIATKCTEIVALIQAPSASARLFDEWGGLEVQAWRRRRLPASGRRVLIEEQPRDQARAVAQVALEAEGRGRVAIGIADRGLLGGVESALRARGLRYHSGFGRPLGETSPWRLVEALGAYLKSRDYRDLALLLRHPPFELYISAKLSEIDVGREGGSGELGAKAVGEDWLSVLDLYRNETLQSRVGVEWPGDPSKAAVVASIDWAITEGLGLDDRGHRSAERRVPQRDSLAAWISRVRGFLAEVYEVSALEARSEVSRSSVFSLGEFLGELEEAWRGGDVGSMSLEESIDVLVHCGQGELVAEDGSEGIDVLGWLELRFDTAPAAVVLGLNEGSIPQATSPGSLLSPQLRRELGMSGDDERFARDLYILNVLEESRELTLVAGRRGLESEPLVPSRLLLACPDERMAEVVLSFYQGSGERRVGDEPGTDVGSLLLAAPRSEGRLLARLQVTGFKDYLQCPYRFYLKHVLGLRQIADTARELDPGAFGALLHKILGDFAGSFVADSADPERVIATLSQFLDRAVEAQVGRTSLVAVRIQVEQLRRRLETFARWHVSEVSKGWRVVAEYSERRMEAELDVDGQGVLLVGRIDRLDEHPEHGFRLLDFKSAERPRRPEETHREGPPTARRWRDLQLPLYELILKQNGITEPLQLGYVNLSRQLGGDPLAMAGWSAAERGEAVEVARGVVRSIWQGRFWPPSEPPPYDDGLGGLAGDGFEEREALIAVSGKRGLEEPR